MMNVDKCKSHHQLPFLNPVSKAPKSFDTALEQVYYYNF